MSGVKEQGAAPQHGPQAGRERDLVIDLVRFVCLALVVVGHCMMVSPVLHRDGTVTIGKHPGRTSAGLCPSSGSLW